MKTTYFGMILAALALAGCATSPKSCACKACSPCNCDGSDPVVGNWEGRLPYDTMYATSIIVSRDEEGAPKALTLWRWGSPQECVDVQVQCNKFSFRLPSGCLYRGTVCKDMMMAQVAPCDQTGKQTGEWQDFNCWRNPPIEPASTDEAQLGEPINLFADGLAGWKVMDGSRSGWSFKDGVLSNRITRNKEGHAAVPHTNLMTKRSDFYDFNLEYDVRVPAGCNSGVYLRGRYEIQTLDSYGKPVDMHNMAAYYGRVTPSVSAEKPAGEWQHVNVTLYKRHLTVELNGVRIIDNAPVVGVTGGAIDADEFVAGPLYIQGDHSDADYKNMVLRPAL